MSTLSGTDKRGILDSPFLIPATYPGIYTISAKIDQQTLASTQYRVVSRATLFASAAPGAYGEDVEVKGIHFLPNLKLLLAVYPMFKGPKPSSLGRVETSGSGTFRFRTSSRRLGAGEYMLQAWSMGNIAAQMASTYFQVAL